MLDPLGRILTEIRDDAAVAALTTKVRGGEPAPGDALGPGSYQRFVVLVRLGGAPDPLLPIQDVRLGLRCYGTTAQDATALYGACSDAIHRKGPRIAATSGLGIYVSDDETGGQADTDPDTDQPLETGVISLIATTQAVT